MDKRQLEYAHRAMAYHERQCAYEEWKASPFRAYIKPPDLNPVTFRLNEVKTMPYADYLRSPEWLERRNEALERANHKCQLCGASDIALHVHHNTYENRGAELPRDLIVLCADCHSWHHNQAARRFWMEHKQHIEQVYADHIKK